jgi:hypothetical protein
MPQLQMMITNAGLDALVVAEGSGTNDILITELGLTDQPFVMAPTLTALPGEFKTLNTVNGQEIAPNVIHLTAYDQSADTYDVTGFGLYLDDGTLFAVYSALADPVLSKAELAYGLIAVDIAFTNNAAANIAFGGALFLYPPASETIPGIARFATQAEVDAVADGPDSYREVVTDKTLRAHLAPRFAAVTTALNSLWAGLTSLTARTITGTGLVQGGGDLSANRTLTVEAGVETDLSGSSAMKVVTIALLGLFRLFAAQGGFGIFGFHVRWGSFSIGANTQTGVTFPVGFPNACYVAVAQGSAQDASDQDNYVHAVAGSQSAGGFTAHNGHGAMSANYLAIGS